MQLKFDHYTIYARFFPCIISALPLFVLWHFLSDFEDITSMMSYILSLKFLGTFSFSIVFLYFYAQLIRVTSKFFEKHYFTETEGFPTTYLMTYKDRTFSAQYKDKYRAKILELFNLQLLDANDEKKDIVEARRRLNETTKHVILKVRSGYLVNKHNVWYGFFRNLIGGSIYSSIFCVINILLGFFLLNNITLIIVSFILLIPYVVILIFHKPILIQNGDAYAKQLIGEFMSL